MLQWGLTATLLVGSLFAQVDGLAKKPSARKAPIGWERYLREPRSAVLFVLCSVLVIGGGRKLVQGWKARGAIGRLETGKATPEEITAAAEYGRTGLMEFFRLLGSDEPEPIRNAAGHAISILWARDDLIGEEEKALVRRGYQVDWLGRRRYPRGLRSAIPFAARFGVPFLRSDGPGVRPDNLEWSYRVVGARRAGLETFSPWVMGPTQAVFEIVPSDFETDGPHKLVLQTRVRTRGLTESWEIELPHVPFNFEFDHLLAVDALFALPDETRAGLFSKGLRLLSTMPEPYGTKAFLLPLSDGMAIRDLPIIEVTTPLPCDLAHVIEVEFKDIPGRFPAGNLSVSGRWNEPNREQPRMSVVIDTIEGLPDGSIDRPGLRSLRAWLVPNPDLGWADPDVRSIWPETIETNWVDVEIVRI